ncbi:MAG: DUF4417 domain-containing protein [Micrococcales bacterium]|jgi:hypothetical protein|nr:DUF4417 domain-containing protein [Actinomycetota bacterium]NCA07777.1 DUF4417 domain-containing protein [Micrococcales bacterium]
MPSWYPVGQPIAGEHQIAQLDRIMVDDVPKYLCAFNQLNRSEKPDITGLHFYVQDKKFRSVLANPEKHLKRFLPFSSLVTPDLTIMSGMPRWMRIQRTHLSRAVGAFYQTRQFKVIPSIRWIDLADLDFVCDGISTNSVFAVGALGNFQDLALRATFEEGLFEVIEILQPAGIMIYGAIRAEVVAKLSLKTTVFQFETAMSARAREIKKTSLEEFELFSYHLD